MKKKIEMIEHFCNFCQDHDVDFDRVEAYYYYEAFDVWEDFIESLNTEANWFICCAFRFQNTEEGFNCWNNVDTLWQAYYKKHCQV